MPIMLHISDSVMNGLQLPEGELKVACGQNWQLPFISKGFYRL